MRPWTGRGSPRYGWRRRTDGTREPVPEEQAVIALVVAARRQGATQSAICQQLYNLGYLARSGRRFIPKQIARMLRA